MMIETGTYTGTGKSQSISVGFRPDLVIIKGDTTQVARFHHEYQWRRRSGGFGNNSSGAQRINLTSNGFTVTSDADVGGDSIVYHWTAFRENKSGDMKVFSLNGTGYDDQLFSNLMTKKPEVLFAKRDSGEYGHIKLALHADNISKPVNSVAQSADIKLLNEDGSFTTSNDSSINEFSTTGADVLGEDTACFAFFPSIGCQVQAYTGTGSEQTISTTVANPKIVFVIPTTALSMRFKTDTMGTDTAIGQNTALAADMITAIGTNSVTLGTDVNVNDSGVDYYLVTIAPTDTVEIKDSVYSTATPQNKCQVVCNQANQVGIVCGQSDEGMIDGALTMEYHGSIEQRDGNGSAEKGWFTRADNSLSGAAGAGNYSWGWMLKETYGGLLVCCTNFFDVDNVDSDMRTMWRTGFMPEHGREYHIVTTHDGFGNWGLYIDGVLRKTRQWNMVTEHSGAPNIESKTGDWTAILGRAHDASNHIFDTSPGIIFNARVYARELTEEEVVRRYKYQALNQSDIIDDVTDFAEEWGATAGTTSTVPATNASGNNGTLTTPRAGWSTRRG